MTERRLYRESKRSIEVVMTKEDDIALTQLLREEFSPLEIVAVDFESGKLQVLESLADAPDLFDVYITNPDPGERSLERLRTALRFCDDSHTEIFRSSLPRRQALYLRSYAVQRGTTKPAGHDQPVELMSWGFIHFVYDRNDAEAHRFTSKMLRLLHGMLVNRYAVVDADTGQVVREDTWARWAGPSALESCRQHPHRYINAAWCEEGEHHFLAPLPPERYEELKHRRRTKR
jgi:hypothetical protein